MDTINELAKKLHNAWRKKKIASGWHLPENCKGRNPFNCHTCLGWFSDEQYSDGCGRGHKGYSDKPTGCAEYTYMGCDNCHPCVNEWEKLTKKEKEPALMNSKIAHTFLERGQKI